jgi:hypothetical protein
MNKHTPGPWRYWRCRVDSRAVPPMYDYAQFANQEGVHVFRAPLLYLSEADARLIAVAPEMFEALQAIACDGLSMYGSPTDMLEKFQDMTRTVVAKVTWEAA